MHFFEVESNYVNLKNKVEDQNDISTKNEFRTVNNRLNDTEGTAQYSTPLLFKGPEFRTVTAAKRVRSNAAPVSRILVQPKNPDCIQRANLEVPKPSNSVFGSENECPSSR